MATYIVGDLQGCIAELEVLLTKVKFSKKRDQLWLVGDLVARGPHSYETLEFVQSLKDSAVTVLGNHDLHLLAIGSGLKKSKPKDLLEHLLNSPNIGKTLDWLRQQPLIIQHPQYHFVMVHAGIPPQWTLKTALRQADNVHHILRSDSYTDLLAQMYANTPSHWHQDLNRIERLRFTINALTRMRYCFADGSLELESKSAPSIETATPLHPWFTLRDPKHDPTIVFGHWASLMGNTGTKRYIGLDTGCVWGNELTLLHWESKKRYTQQAIVG